MRISDWSSDVCSSDLAARPGHECAGVAEPAAPDAGARAAATVAAARPDGRRGEQYAGADRLAAQKPDRRGTGAAGAGERPALSKAAAGLLDPVSGRHGARRDRKSTRLNSSH